jgi:hypothetical protein
MERAEQDEGGVRDGGTYEERKGWSRIEENVVDLVERAADEGVLEDGGTEESCRKCGRMQ